MDGFGVAVTVVGGDKLVIGAWLDSVGSGSVYVYNTIGTLLTTITNPTPPAPGTLDIFGAALAPMEPDMILIGAWYDDAGAVDSGTAYLFKTNGVLLTTFNNPSPNQDDRFGVSLAAVGSDKVVIGAWFDDVGTTNAGAAYLFSTNGTLLTTFTNPTPAFNDYFGRKVASVGSDRILIGAWMDDTGATNAGAAYLFNTNGALVMTFTNPVPEIGDDFGVSLCAVGTDRLIIGAFGDHAAGTDAGAVYLFSTNGTLLTSITNPAPASGDAFGVAVTMLGMDKILVGAYHDDDVATDSGTAYLYSTNGLLLATIRNPTPAAGDFFGTALAALGNDRVLISAYLDDTGATDAGSAYLFDLAPSLKISPTPTNTVFVSWPSAWSGWVIREHTNLNSTNWTTPPEPVSDNGIIRSINVTPSPGSRFYRLTKP